MTKATKHLILAATFAVVFAATDRASAQFQGIVAGGSCTPKVGDDVEVSIHTPRNNNPAIGQRSGVKYVLVNVIQGGKRSGKSIKGGKRTTLMFKVDQKWVTGWLKSVTTKNKGGAKIAMGKITAVSGKFQIRGKDDVKNTVGKNHVDKLSISRKGKALGSITVKWEY